MSDVVGRDQESLRLSLPVPAQEHAIDVGGEVDDPATKESCGTVVAVDNATGTIDLKRGKRSDVPHPTSIVPEPGRRREGAEESPPADRRVGRRPTESTAQGPRSGRPAISSCGARRVRRARSSGRGRLWPPALGLAPSLAGSDPADVAATATRPRPRPQLPRHPGPSRVRQDHPGAQMIVDLVQAGKRRRHREQPQGHRHTCSTASRRRPRSEASRVRIGQKPETRTTPTCRSADVLRERTQALCDALAAASSTSSAAPPGSGRARSSPGSLDVLFVDEAGQVSLANVVAVAPAARSLVLLGDPQQLNQPLKGTHPAGRRALGARPPARRGGHDAAPSWVSSSKGPGASIRTSARSRRRSFYEGRLESKPGRERQRVLGVPPLDGHRLALPADLAQGQRPRLRRGGGGGGKRSSASSWLAAPPGSTTRTSAATDQPQATSW